MEKSNSVEEQEKANVIVEDISEEEAAEIIKAREAMAEQFSKERVEEAKAEEAQAAFLQKIAQQKKVLKSLSKNQLIRIVVEMSIRAFYQQSRLEELEQELNKNPGVENA